MHTADTSGKPTRMERRRREEIARIKGKLFVAGITLAKIDEVYKLPPGTASNTLKEPHLAGERAIAAALKTRPHLLWFSRYHSDGSRKAPQPAEHYRYGRRATAPESVAA